MSVGAIFLLYHAHDWQILNEMGKHNIASLQKSQRSETMLWIALGPVVIGALLTQGEQKCYPTASISRILSPKVTACVRRNIWAN
jgi:hypothetical protein